MVSCSAFVPFSAAATLRLCDRWLICVVTDGGEEKQALARGHTQSQESQQKQLYIGGYKRA